MNFDGDQLPPDWKMLNPDPMRWTMQPKRSLMLISQNTPCPALKDGKNLLLLDRQLPKEDFDIVVKGSIQIQGRGSRLAVILLSDDANYFWAVLQGDYDSYTQRRVYFQKAVQGKTAGSFQADMGNTPMNDVYLKIERRSNDFVGYYAPWDRAKPDNPDQIAWSKLGTMPWINFQGKLAICAVNFDNAPEIGAEIYSVSLRRK